MGFFSIFVLTLTCDINVSCKCHHPAVRALHAELLTQECISLNQAENKSDQRQF